MKEFEEMKDYLISFDDNIHEEECQWCNGSGLDFTPFQGSRYPTGKCDFCDGTGFVSLPEDYFDIPY